MNIDRVSTTPVINAAPSKLATGHRGLLTVNGDEEEGFKLGWEKIAGVSITGINAGEGGTKLRSSLRGVRARGKRRPREGKKKLYARCIHGKASAPVNWRVINSNLDRVHRSLRNGARCARIRFIFISPASGLCTLFCFCAATLQGNPLTPQELHATMVAFPSSIFVERINFATTIATASVVYSFHKDALVISLTLLALCPLTTKSGTPEGLIKQPLNSNPTGVRISPFLSSSFERNVQRKPRRQRLRGVRRQGRRDAPSRATEHAL